MLHRIYTGPFAALEERLLATIFGQQHNDALAPVPILLGSNILASHLKSRMARRGRAAANVRFYTFLDLARRLASSTAAGPDRPRLPYLGASLLLEDILEMHVAAPFARMARLGGFRGALLDTFRDLRDAGVVPLVLQESLTDLRSHAPDRARHLSALAELYQLFTERTAAFHDTAEDFRRASAAAAQAQGLLGSRSLLIYGIYDVTGLQAELLHSLIESLDLIYFIPLGGPNASHFVMPFLTSRIRELDVEPISLAPADRGSGLDKLVQRLSAAPDDSQAGTAILEPLAADGSFALVSVPGESRAAVEVIREVLRAVNDGVIRGFYEAAVILRHPEDEVPVLAEAFRLRGVPCFVHGGSPFGQRPLARAVLAIAGLETRAFSRQAILTAMELVAAALPAEAAAAWDVPSWSLLTNDPRFLAGVEAWDSGTDTLVRQARASLRTAEVRAVSGEDERDDEFRRPTATAAQRQLESAVSLRARWLALRQAAADWPAACSWQEWARFLARRLGPLLGKSEDWDVFSNVFDDIASLAALSGESGAAAPQIARARAAAALSEAISALSSAEGRFQCHGVNLLSAAAARGLRFPLVLVPGLEEGRFPARLRQDPLLLDAERLEIGRPPRLPLKALRGEEEKLLFALAVSAAEKRLVLMTSRLDEASDRERIPSQFFLRCAAAARGRTVGLGELMPETVPGLRSVSLDDHGSVRDQIAVDEGEIRLGLLTENPGRSRGVLEALAQVEPQRMCGPISYDRSRWLQKLTGFDGLIQDPDLRRSVKSRLEAGSSQLSASRIEDYAKCPYFFYLRRVQELEKWMEEEAAEGMDPVLRGQLMHRILEGFMRDFIGRKWAAAPVAELQEALQLRAMRTLEEDRPAALPDLLWEIERDRMLETLGNWLRFELDRMDSSWMPIHLERPFGALPGSAGTPPYRLRMQGSALEFRGRIDRIDMQGNGQRLRVIDYKVGALPRSMSGSRRTALMAGEKIQLAIYWGAISTFEDLACGRSIEGEYLHLQPADRSIARCCFEDSELRAALQRLPGMLEVVQEGIEGGVFFARARGRVRPEGHCMFCDFLPVCGKDREQRQARKASDPAVVRFAQLQEIDGPTGEEE